MFATYRIKSLKENLTVVLKKTVHIEISVVIASVLTQRLLIFTNCNYLRCCSQCLNHASLHLQQAVIIFSQYVTKFIVKAANCH